MARIVPYFWKIRKELHVQGDCLFRGSRLVVPQNLTRAILTRAHEDQAGAAAMKDRCGHLWWPWMNHQIQTLSSGCKTCSYTGKFLQPGAELGQPETPTHPNQIVELDFWGPLRSSYKNKQYVLVAIDRFSKYVSTKIVDAPSAYNTIKFLKQYIAIHSTMTTIALDQGTAFTSRDFKHFCKVNNIAIQYSDFPILLTL